MGSVREGFEALVLLAADDVLRQRLSRKAEALSKERKTASELARGYLEMESEIVRSSDSLDEAAVRERVRGAFSGTERDMPCFDLLFRADDKQFVGLANRLIAVYAGRCRRFLGHRVVDRLVRDAVAGTKWKDMEVTVEKGVLHNPVRMRGEREIAELLLAVFDGWHRGMRVAVGEGVGQALFEESYRAVMDECGYLPSSGRLLGATPVDVLTKEKAERIHSLESTTTTQARSIQAADEDLKRQAERLRRTVEELEATKRQLEVVSRARSEFIDVVAHQFRTPLSSIRWNAELMTDALEEKKVDEEYREAVDMMRQKSVYLIDTLDRVFMTLDIDTGGLVIDRKPVFLWELVQDAYKEYAKAMERKGVSWSFKKKKDQVVEIPIDKTKVMTALRIVIGNAVMYSKEGGKVTADLRPERIDGKVHMTLTVQDDGIGLGEDGIRQFWDKFFRSKESKLVAPDGTGLGNYVVKHVIEAHGGRVRVDSPGKEEGTIVSLSLPIEA